MTTVPGEIRALDVGGRSAWTGGYRTTVALAIVALAGAGWIAADAMSDLWYAGLHEPESSHILLVPVVFAWLFWVRRGRVRECDGSGRWPGAALLVLGVTLWTTGYHYQVQSFWHAGAVAMMAGAALAVVGRDALWKFLPVWGSLIFLVPVPARVRFFVAGPLERVTAELTQSVGEVLGMAVGRSGNQLSVNGVDVCVAEACNGMRLAFTLLLACYVAMFYRPLRGWVRAVVLLASPVVAVGANVVRLVPTVWVFGHYPLATAERFHDVTGWVMLILAFGFLTGFCRLLEWVGLPITPAPTDGVEVGGS